MLICGLIMVLAPLRVAYAIPWRVQPVRLSDVDLVKYLLEQQLEEAQAAAKAREQAAEPQPSSAQTSVVTYVVKKGDTLWSIAQRFGTTVANLQQMNGLRGDTIKVGQTLQVGGESVQVHAVQAGDTLSGIASRYRTSVTSLAAANGISSHSTIYPGQEIYIPQGGEVSRSGSASSARLIWPVLGTVTSGWGYRTRFEKFHYGLDIAAPTGTPIKAVRGGVVEFAGWKNGYGYCVFLDHGDGMKTAYGHASKLYVKRGQRVEQGQTIAAVGSTGFSTGPHVHFEVRINGRLVDPATVLPRR